jgi:VIT1/CCC1 family predicted Fe2+/Mn2+ transporter
MAVPIRETTNRSFTDLLRDLRDETSTLFSQEVSLARHEMSEKINKMGKDAAYVASGGLVLYAGVLFILAAVSVLCSLLLVQLGVSALTSQWLAPLIIGVIVAGIGAALVIGALRALKHTSLTPEKTVQSLKEDKQWVQQKLR